MRPTLTTLALATALAFLAAPAHAEAPDRTSLIDVALAVNADTVSASDPDGEFATLIAAVLAADPAVLETLDGPGSFTVFAPTDAAFAALGLDASTVGDLPAEALTEILLYHVVRGNRTSSSLLNASRARTLDRAFLFPDLRGADLFIVDTDEMSPDAQVVIADVEADNGVIHAIDAVLFR